jgi:hypothetical protein
VTIRRLFYLILLIALSVASPSAAQSELPFVGSIEFGPGMGATIMMVPDGTGPPLTEARDADYNPVDATITIQIVDIAGNPIANFPREEIWLVFAVNGGTATGCLTVSGAPPGGIFLADAHTDANGFTEFALPLYGGGWSDGPVWVYVIRAPAQHPEGWIHPPLPLRVNSPDLTGDNCVNLIDVGEFSSDYFETEYSFRSDLDLDGALNLADVGALAQFYGVECP